MLNFTRTVRPLLLLLFLIQFHFSYGQDTLTLADDRIRLLDLYTSTNGPGWTVKTNWNTAADVSTWHGVTVVGGRVTRIDLSGNHLTGSLPASIGMLSQLQEFFIPQNQVAGSIPPELGTISTLTGLNMDNNKISGLIPASLGNLPNLVYLSMGGNEITGSIPAQLGNLPVIESMYLWNNKLNGSLPAQLGNLSTLQRFHIQGNFLTGAVPIEFNNLDALQELVISSNDLTDLPDLTGMASITMFNIVYNLFTFQDVIPNLGIPGIQYDYMKYFPITGTTEVIVGSPITLSVAVSDPGNVVQWTKDGVSVGASLPTLTIPSVTGVDAGFYSVTITNPAAPALTLYVQNGNQSGIDVLVYSVDAATEAGYNVAKKLGGASLGIFENVTGRLAANGTVIYVHDELTGTIQKLNATTGQLINTLDVKGSSLGKVSCYSDIEVDGSDAVYISSECESKVIKYTAAGTLAYEILNTGQALGLAFDGAGNLLILWRDASRVSRYNATTGAFLDQIMLSGGPTYALDLEVDNNGDFWITDTNIPAVRKFSASTGALIATGDMSVPAAGVQPWTNFYIAIGSNNNVYAQVFRGGVVQFDNSGGFVRKFGSDETLYDPVGIARTPQGILLGDLVHGLQLFNEDGTYSKRITPRNANGQFYVPKKIAMDSKFNRYVCDYFNGRIQKFDSKGNFLLTIGSLGTGATQLKYPQCIAIDANDVIYVADDRNNRIQKYSTTGTHLGTIGTFGSGPGQVDTPRGIAISKKGFVYVVDVNNYRIQKFNRDGTHILSFGSQGSGPGQFTLPQSIAVEDDGNLLITDNSKLIRFDESGQFISEIALTGSTIAEVATDSYGYIYASYGSLTSIYDNGCYTKKLDKTGALVTTISNALYVSSNTTGDTLWISGTPHFVSIIYPNVKAPSATDRTILEELYNSTNGNQWTNKNNWMTANPINTWYGVSVSAGKVVSLKLNGNNLDGTLPSSLTNLKTLNVLELKGNKLTGELPAALNNLTVLQQLNVADNALTGPIPTLPTQLVKANFENNLFTSFTSVPAYLTMANVSNNELATLGNLTGNSLETLFVNGNNLSFQDLAQNTSLGNFDYLDQGLLGQPIVELLDVGTDFQLEVVTPGSGNLYAWRKVVKQDTVYVAGATNPTHDLPSIGRSNMGIYIAEVTNPALPGLTLKTYPQTVWATANLSGRLLVAEDVPAEEGNVSLFKITETAYDTIGPISINNDGTYLFEKVILADYQLMGFADTLKHEKALPTYYTRSIYWEEADTLFVNENRVNLDIISEFKPNPPQDGTGSISGTLYEDPENNGGRTQARQPVQKSGATVRRAQSSGRPREGAEVVYELIDHTFTNKEGEFSFNNLEPGVYWLNLQYPGYPMDSTSFIEITVGSGLKDRGVLVEADVIDKKIFVRQLIILGWEYPLSRIDAYPNPTANKLFLANLPEKHVQLAVVDLQGKQKNCAISYDREMSAWTIDVSHLPRGMYVVKVKSKTDNQSLKISIE